MLSSVVRRIFAAGLVIGLAAPPRPLTAQGPRSRPIETLARPLEARIRDLLGRMTLEEKFWQLFMIPGDLDDPRNDYSHGIFGLQVTPSPDSTGDAAGRDAERINAIQRYFVTQTRLGIPIIPFEEALHGLETVGRDRVSPGHRPRGDLGYRARSGRVGGAIAKETRSRGIRQVLSPVINIAADSRWGRVEETYGEDPWLTSAMAVAYHRTARIGRCHRHAEALRGERRRRWP